MTRTELFDQILKKKSFLCVGLDTDIHKIPSFLLNEPDPIFAFNKLIIENTAEFAVAYKPNIAFYEAMGPKGWESLQKTMEIIPKEIFTIADAKRGDIGNTSGLYARTFFDKKSSGLDFHSVTVAPYMGKDSVVPFLEFKDKWVIILALTSNAGSQDFQYFSNGKKTLFEEVLSISQEWGSIENTMYVVGATHAEDMQQVRRLAPDHFLLVPGVGAQGGSLHDVAKYGMNSTCGLLVNSSRGIIYASKDLNFGQIAGIEAKKLRDEMDILLDQYLAN